jgi:hypothetical protein
MQKIKENRITKDKKFFVDTMIMLDIFIGLCNEESNPFGHSNTCIYKHKLTFVFYMI